MKISVFGKVTDDFRPGIKDRKEAQRIARQIENTEVYTIVLFILGILALIL